ncbi:TonB-dependent receptor [Bacteroidota bacterium]
MKQVILLLAFQCITFITFSQFNLRGKVSDENGDPMIGANVVFKSTFLGTVSDVNGEFVFTNLKSEIAKIQVSFIGYKTQDVTINLNETSEINITLAKESFIAEDIIVSATRVKSDVPVAHYNISKEKLESKNTGQDIPYLLELTPSFVSSSDAGTGIGYTNFKIRGTDLERINVTINGIPLNDAESHGVWWVDLPDFSSSTENIQIQRGVGASSNGSGAFGATINLQSSSLKHMPYTEINSGYGSFNSFVRTIKIGTGLLKEKFIFEGRVSKITSDGFIDRAWSDLFSYYLSGGLFTEKNVFKFNIFSGTEDTYQAWNGVPKVRLENDLQGMNRYEEHWLYTPGQTNEMINSDSRTYNYYTYENEIDHYDQTHYQLHYTREIANNFNFNTSLHYTHGQGYYEQYRENDDLMDYQLDTLFTSNDTITSSDLIRRKWLNNHFYGITYSLIYDKSLFDLTIGGGFHNYDGDHYGKIIWAKYASNGKINHEWYRSNGLKRDINIYGKLNYYITKQLNLYGDIQYRFIDYSIKGIDDDMYDISLNDAVYNFVNPKIGCFYKFTDQNKLYFLFATANREPKRSDYIDALKKSEVKLPTQETLYDFELGYEHSIPKMNSQINLYYMNYKDQLVQTGEINDVGDALLINVPKSYRRGIELITQIKPNKDIEWGANITLSQNKIIDFKDYVDDWDNWGMQIESDISKTDISFSPNIIAGSDLIYKPFVGFGVNLSTKYVGLQYIDNTSSKDRSIDPYLVNNLSFNYEIIEKLAKSVKLQISILNLFNEKYETYAWVYRYYLGGGEYTMDGYFPQAGRHFMASINILF